jgi:tRNA nucleotidyltransferase (CCA-adding enzyme)
MRLLVGEQVLSVLLEFPDVLAVFIPEIAPTIGFDQCTRYHKYDVWAHTAHAVAGAAPDPLVRLTLLFHDLGKPPTFFTDEESRGHFYGHDKVGEGIARERLFALRFDRRTIDTVAGLIAHHQDKLKAENVRRLLRRLGEKNLRLLIEVKRGDIISHADDFVSERLDKITEAETELERLLAEEACFALKDLAVNGTDLRELGYPQGRLLGETLDALLDKVVDEELPNERAALLREAAVLLRAAEVANAEGFVGAADAADAAGVADAAGSTGTADAAGAPSTADAAGAPDAADPERAR